MIFEFATVWVALFLLGVVLCWRPPTRWLWAMWTVWAAAFVPVVGALGNAVGLPAGVLGTALLAGPAGFLGAGAVSTAGWTHLHGGAAAHDAAATYFAGILGESRGGADLKWVTLVALAGVAAAVVKGRSGHHEQVLLALLAGAAGLFTFTTDNLVVLYLNLELQALALYTLVGYYRFEDESTDAALRYLMAGSLVSGFLLVGFAATYGAAGTFAAAEVRTAGIGGVWVVGALFFKLGVAPFHFWTPSVYTPVGWPTLLLVTAPAKVNLWFLLGVGLAPLRDGASDLLWWAGWASIGVGAVGGLFQTAAAPLLAYSGVLNGGYLLLLLAGGDPWGFTYYLVVYVGATLSMVAVLAVWGAHPVGWPLRLGVVAPLVVYYLALNLGGLPVFPGFFGKLWLVRGVLAGAGWPAAFVVVLASIVPAVYYVGLAGGALFGRGRAEPSREAGDFSASLVFGLYWGLIALVAFVVGLV